MIKHITISSFLVLGLLAVEVFAQSDGSAAIADLRAQIRSGNMEAILKVHDKTLIPYLRGLASDGKTRLNRNSPAYYAHIALARLNDPGAFEQIIGETDDPDPDVQDKGIDKLSYIDGSSSYRKLYELLDDSKSRPNPQCSEVSQGVDQQVPKNCDVIFFPRNVMAINALLRLVQDPPTQSRIASKESVQMWKEWLERNNLLQ